MKEGAIGEVMAIEQDDVSMNGGEPQRLKALFFLVSRDRYPGLGRLVKSMLERDHEVTVALEHERRAEPLRAEGGVAGLGNRYPGFDHVRVRPRRDLWRIPAGATRRGLDYLAFLDSEPGGDGERGARARQRAPRVLRALLFLPPFRWRPGRRMLAWWLRRLEAAMPLPGAVKGLIRERAPDVTVVSWHAELDSSESEFIRVAHATRTPSALLLSPGKPSAEARIRDLPTVALVNDQDRVNEVVETYGLPRDQVQAVGFEGSDGTKGTSPAGAMEAISAAAATERVAPPSGRILRPFLWLATPLLFLLLLLMHPRTTSREVVRTVGRMRRELRTRREAKRKRGAREGAEAQRARTHATKAEARDRAEAKRQRKDARAQEKRQKREYRETAKPRKSARRSEEQASGEESETMESPR
jgi:hypothetical protein